MPTVKISDSPIRTYNLTELTDGCIDKIAEAVVRKLAEQTEPHTYVINPQEPTNDEKCFECDDFFTCGGQCNKIEDEPQTCEECEHWNDTEDGCADRHGCKTEPTTEDCSMVTECSWK